VNNSVEAGATEIEVAVVSVEDELVVRVSDNGPGFTREEAGQLLEAFYTTKSHGTGLGLAVVQAVVKAHQGRFAIDAPVTGGAVAIISLPLVRSLSTGDRRQQPPKTD
jgi:two-component system sensor histidine kinase FlrB